MLAFTTTGSTGENGGCGFIQPKGKLGSDGCVEPILGRCMASMDASCGNGTGVVETGGFAGERRTVQRLGLCKNEDGRLGGGYAHSSGAVDML